MDNNLIQAVETPLSDDKQVTAQTKDFGLISVLVPAIISAISIAASVGTAAHNRKFQKQQQKAQQEYDSPAAQMQRLKDAGLNPNLALGSISSGSFGDSPSPLSDMGQVVGNAGQSAMSGLNFMFAIKQKQQELELMEERINQLRISNAFSSLSNPDRLRLLAANVLSANQVNDLRDFDLKFANWYNSSNASFQPYFSANGVDTSFGPSSPRMFSNIYQMQQLYNTNDKVYQDLQNAIDNGDLLKARIISQGLINDRYSIARDFEQAFNMPFSNASPLDKFLNIVIGGLMERYGPRLMQKLYDWIDSL